MATLKCVQDIIRQLDVTITAGVCACSLCLCPWVGTGCRENHTPESMAVPMDPQLCTSHTHTHHPPTVTHGSNPPPSHCLIASAIWDLFQGGGRRGEKQGETRWSQCTSNHRGFTGLANSRNNQACN